MRPANFKTVVVTVRTIMCLHLILASMFAGAQLCSDPVNVIYGITNTGTIHAIDVNTGVVDPQINPAYPGNAPDQSNGLAYNPINGKFYYFKRIPSSPITEFVSFDPATNSYTILSSPSTSNPVYSGSITNDGTGYYCWDTQGTLFYYQISNNTWTTISSNIKDQFGKDVDSIIRLHYSGDGAIDGSGNLWLMPSSATRYGLFKLNFPLPTAPVATVTVEQVIPMTVSTSTFVGICFNTSGQIFMTTSSANLYRLEDNLSLTLMSTLSTNMADLTSCNFPLSVLAGTDYSFTALLVNGNVALAWKPSLQQGSVTYILERSRDGRRWNTLGTGNDLSFSMNKISFIDASPNEGRNFYRIKIIDSRNNTTYSVVRTVEYHRSQTFTLWPNPVLNSVFIKNSAGNAVAIVYSESGIRVKSAIITSGLNNIDLRTLPTGKYIITVVVAGGSSATFRIVKK